MANEGVNPVERAISFAMRLAVSMILPAWGALMIVIGASHRQGWWIASGVVVFAVGAIFLAGSSIVTPFLPGSRPSPDRSGNPAGRELKP
jgi:hypothetical protein